MKHNCSDSPGKTDACWMTFYIRSFFSANGSLETSVSLNSICMNRPEFPEGSFC